MGGDLSGNAREGKEDGAGARHGHAAASAFEAPSRDNNNSAVAQSPEIDLLSLIPENF